MRNISLPRGWDEARLMAFERAQVIVEGEDWPSEVPLSAFTQGELAVAAQLRTVKRRFEWTASRYAAKTLAVERGICHQLREIVITSRDERPTMLAAGNASLHLSLSHSGPFAAAALSRQRVGVDIEVVRLVDARAAHLFLTDDEAASVAGNPVADALLHFWCAKEAAWKRRSEEHATLKQTALQFGGVRDGGLEFRAADGALVVTARVEENLIAALAK